jgi:hypothetical protein
LKEVAHGLPEKFAMRSIKTTVGAVLVGAALLLAGCGGGGASPSVAVSVAVAPPPAAFDVIMYANGVQVAGVEVLPGEEQTVYLPAGQSFVLDSSDPVAWSLVVGGVAVPGTGNTIHYAGATVVQTRTTDYQVAAKTYLTTPAALQTPVGLVYYATALGAPSQLAKINIVLTN